MTLFSDFLPRRTLGHIGCLMLAAAALAITTPASANPAESASASAGAAETGRPSAAVSRGNRAADNRRICVEDTYTGTRIRRRVCKTQAEWDAEGGLELERLR